MNSIIKLTDGDLAKIQQAALALWKSESNSAVSPELFVTACYVKALAAYAGLLIELPSRAAYQSVDDE